MTSGPMLTRAQHTIEKMRYKVLSDFVIADAAGRAIASPDLSCTRRFLSFRALGLAFVLLRVKLVKGVLCTCKEPINLPPDYFSLFLSPFD